MSVRGFFRMRTQHVLGTCVSVCRAALHSHTIDSTIAYTFYAAILLIRLQGQVHPVTY